MKASDFIADFLSQYVDHVFVLTGGCVVHIIDSIGEHPDIDYIPVQHEQAGAMAADAYARIRGLGVAIATSGPGATNLLTGVCCSYYDSIPTLFITGQVPSNQLKGDSESRQVGFQETDVVSIFKPVTKHAVQITSPNMIRFELEKAVWMAQEGRKGPVLLDICDDVQRADIDPETMIRFKPPVGYQGPRDAPLWTITVIDKICAAKRPLLIIGAGAKHVATKRFIEYSGIPFTLTWGAKDLIFHDHPLFAGGFGVTEGRAGNFAVQNADLIIAVGTRLDTHEVGNDFSTFAPNAYKIIVDIDQAELDKHPVDLPIKMSANLFYTYLHFPKQRTWNIWMSLIKDWKKKYPIVLPEYRKDDKNPYTWMEKLSQSVDDYAIIVTDCGSNLIWTMQVFEVKKHTIISAFNHSPMGYSLPAAIGAKLAAPDRQVVCIIGDGGFRINSRELETIERHNINIEIYIMNNYGYGIIEGTQDTWLDGRHHAANYENGLPEITYIDKVTSTFLNLSIIDLNPGSFIAPKLMAGRPIHDAHPLLSREELEENMI